MRAYDSIKAERGREVSLEATDFLEQARQLLSKNIPIQIRMSGSSMSSAIEDGDVITVEALGEEPVRTGDIILYNSVSDTAVIHRVVRLERGSSEKGVLTRGDAAAQNDIAVPLHRVLGRVKQIERAGESITVSRSQYKMSLKVRAWLHRMKFWE